MRTRVIAIATGVVLALAITGSPIRLVPDGVVSAACPVEGSGGGPGCPPATSTDVEASQATGGAPTIAIVIAGASFLLAFGYVIRIDPKVRR